MKKTILNLFVLLALFATVFSSCKDDDDDKKPAATKGTKAELTGVLYALQQYAKPDSEKKVALTFVDPEGQTSKLYFTISDGATITKPTGVTKTSAADVTVADGLLPTLKENPATKEGLKSAPSKLADTNVWEMALPTEAKTIGVEVTSEDGNTIKSYSINVSDDGGTPTPATVTGDLTASDAFTFVATLKVEGTGDKKTVTVTGKLPAETGKYYVAWSVTDATTPTKINLGVLETDGATTLTDVDEANITDKKFVVTIETDGGIQAPAGPAIWKGDFKDGKIMLGATEVTEITGSYILATPSDNPTKTDNEANGIWFLKEGTTKTAGLSLPDLTDTDFVYEGWIVNGTNKVSTGKFDKPTGADAQNLYTGTGTVPGFPGEDFLKNPAVNETGHLDDAVFTGLVPLNRRKAVISIEPRSEGNTELTPYFIQPLSGTIPAAAPAQ